MRDGALDCNLARRSRSRLRVKRAGLMGEAKGGGPPRRDYFLQLTAHMLTPADMSVGPDLRPEEPSTIRSRRATHNPRVMGFGLRWVQIYQDFAKRGNV